MLLLTWVGVTDIDASEASVAVKPSPENILPLLSIHLLTAASYLDYMPLCEAGDIAIQDTYFTPIIMRSYNYLFFLFVGFLIFSIRLDSFLFSLYY